MVEKTHQRIELLISWSKGLIGGLFLLTALWAYEAKAQEIRLISDEETEQLLAKIVQPLFKAANIKYYRNSVFIVEDNSLNAFVADGNRLFIHTGTITRADNINELAGVIAHETGHIMGGHILRQKLKNQEMNEVSLISALLAGTTAALSGQADIAMAVLLGGQSSALNHYMRYRTEEERSADESAAKLLDATGQAPHGILQFMKKIKQDNELSGREESPYFRTHPITGERIAFFEKQAASSPYSVISSDDETFERVKAKLKAYLLPPEQTLRLYPLTRNDILARYAQAIAYLKQLKFAQSLNIIDELLSKEPNNPFFYELQGQILLETGKLNNAKKSFAKAYKLLPQSYLMQMNYAQAILEDNPNKEDAKQAIVMLNNALVRSKNAFLWVLLAKAYGISGDMAAANYASAEYSLKLGEKQTAEKQLKEALKYPTSKQLKLKIDDLAQRLKKL